MERIIIINHNEHEVYIEDIDENVLAEKYHGEEEEYIKDNYDVGDNFSWDYVTNIYYLDDINECHEIEPTQYID